MGNHAKPRTRVRSAAMGVLTIGATLTGLGLTAAALDPPDSNAVNADGTLSGNPVDLAAAGLGSPVPVASVTELNSGAPLAPIVPSASTWGAGAGAGAGSGSGSGDGGGNVRSALEQGRPIQPTISQATGYSAFASQAPVVQTAGGQGQGKRQGQGEGQGHDKSPSGQTTTAQPIVDAVTTVNSAVAPLLQTVAPQARTRPAPSSPEASVPANDPAPVSTQSTALPDLPVLSALPKLSALPALAAAPAPAAPALPSLPGLDAASGLLGRIAGLL